MARATWSTPRGHFELRSARRRSSPTCSGGSGRRRDPRRRPPARVGHARRPGDSSRAAARRQQPDSQLGPVHGIAGALLAEPEHGAGDRTVGARAAARACARAPLKPCASTQARCAVAERRLRAPSPHRGPARSGSTCAWRRPAAARLPRPAPASSFLLPAWMVSSKSERLCGRAAHYRQRRARIDNCRHGARAVGRIRHELSSW